jgi:hypothetical protein
MPLVTRDIGTDVWTRAVNWLTKSKSMLSFFIMAMLSAPLAVMHHLKMRLENGLTKPSGTQCVQFYMAQVCHSAIGRMHLTTP